MVRNQYFEDSEYFENIPTGRSIFDIATIIDDDVWRAFLPEDHLLVSNSLLGIDLWELEISWVERYAFSEELDIQLLLFHTARRTLISSQLFMEGYLPHFTDLAEFHNQAVREDIYFLSEWTEEYQSIRFLTYVADMIFRIQIQLDCSCDEAAARYHSLVLQCFLKPNGSSWYRIGREIHRNGLIITSNWWSSLLPRNHPNYANVPPSNTLRQMEEREFFHRIVKPLDETGSYRIAQRAILIAHDYIRHNIFTDIDDYCNDITLDRINAAEEALVNCRSSPRLNARRTTIPTIRTTTVTLTASTATTTTIATTTTTTAATATTTTTAATATTRPGGVTTRAKRWQQSTWSEAEELGECFEGQAKVFFYFFIFSIFFFFFFYFAFAAPTRRHTRQPWASTTTPTPAPAGPSEGRPGRSRRYVLSTDDSLSADKDNVIVEISPPSPAVGQSDDTSLSVASIPPIIHLDDDSTIFSYSLGRGF